MADNSANKVSVLVVDSLPLVGVSGIIYLVPITDIGETNKFKEYIWLKNGQIWESLGAVTANLDNYAVLNGDNTFTADQTIVGTLSTTGTITAGSIVTSAISGDVAVSGSYTTTGSVAASTITTERLIGTLNVTNGDINTTGTLNADTVTANIISGNINVEGDITASGTINGATITAQSIDGVTNISGDVNVNTVTATVLTAENINGDITSVSGDVTLGETTITGDVTINGGMDTGLNGEPVVTIDTDSFTISHEVWFNNITQSTITVLPGVWNNAVKTCYLKTSIPVTLTGVIRIDDNPEMESGKTYIFALQQIDETNIIANIAYSVTI